MRALHHPITGIDMSGFSLVHAMTHFPNAVSITTQETGCWRATSRALSTAMARIPSHPQFAQSAIASILQRTIVPLQAIAMQLLERVVHHFTLCTREHMQHRGLTLARDRHGLPASAAALQTDSWWWRLLRRRSGVVTGGRCIHVEI